MKTIIEWFSWLYNVQGLVATVGYWGMALIIFVETGLLVGFFLPGDSLLFAAGFACAPGNALLGDKALNIWILNAVLIPAAILGDSVGYFIGYRAGAGMYNRPKTLFFRRDHLLATKSYYESHGGITIIVARFVPLLRTFAPVVAGIAQMPYRTFVTYNIVGGVLWVSSLSALGYWLGGYEWIGKNLDKAIICVIIVSLIPAVITILHARMQAKKAAAAASLEQAATKGEVAVNEK